MARLLMTALMLALLPFACNEEPPPQQLASTSANVSSSSATSGITSSSSQGWDPCAAEMCPTCNQHGCCVTWDCGPCDELSPNCGDCYSCASGSRACYAKALAWSAHEDANGFVQCGAACCGTYCEESELPCWDGCMAQYPEVAALWLKEFECAACTQCLALCSPDRGFAAMVEHYCPGFGGAGGSGGGGGGAGGN